jgi:hypothetical protein
MTGYWKDVKGSFQTRHSVETYTVSCCTACMDFMPVNCKYEERKEKKKTMLCDSHSNIMSHHESQNVKGFKRVIMLSSPW